MYYVVNIVHNYSFQKGTVSFENVANSYGLLGCNGQSIYDDTRIILDEKKFVIVHVPLGRFERVNSS